MEVFGEDEFFWCGGMFFEADGEFFGLCEVEVIDAVWVFFVEDEFSFVDIGFGRG